MNISNLIGFSQRGELHTNQNEDFFVLEQKGDFDFMAVLDGCSSGRDAHFASSFMGKSLKANFKRIVNEYIGDEYFLLADDGLNAQDLLTEIILGLAEDMKQVMTLLDLKDIDLLSTLITFLYDHMAKQGYIIAFGDGVIMVDDKIIVINHNNYPGYLAYDHHLNNFIADPKKFLIEYNNRYGGKQCHWLGLVKRVTLATDGIESYHYKQNDECLSNDDKNKLIYPRAQEPESYINPTGLINDYGYDKVMLELNTKYNLIPYDDITLVNWEPS